MVCAVVDDVTGDGVVEVTGCGVPVAESHHDTHVSHMTKNYNALTHNITQTHTGWALIGVSSSSSCRWSSSSHGLRFTCSRITKDVCKHIYTCSVEEL